MNNILSKIRATAITTLAFAPLMAHGAQNTRVQTGPPDPAFTSFEDLIKIVDKFLGWLFTILIILSAIFIVMAAFYYLTAGGDEEKVKKAKDRLIYAIVAIAIALVATSVKYVVAKLVGANVNF